MADEIVVNLHSNHTMWMRLAWPLLRGPNPNLESKSNNIGSEVVMSQRALADTSVLSEQVEEPECSGQAHGWGGGTILVVHRGMVTCSTVTHRPAHTCSPRNKAAGGGGSQCLPGLAFFAGIVFYMSLFVYLFQDVKCISYSGYVYKKTLKVTGLCWNYLCYLILHIFLSWYEK